MSSLPRALRRAVRGPLPGVALAALLSGVFAYLGFFRYSYDAYTHMFFADHYRRAWFSLWEVRWYGGFLVTTYPPLAHQVMAVLSFLLGPEGGYGAAGVLASVLIAVGIYYLSECLVEGSGVYASLVAASLPSLGLLLNSYGQLPTVFSTALAVVALPVILRYAREGGGLRLALAALLCASTAHCHHMTAVLFLFPTAALMVLWEAWSRGVRCLLRGLAVAVLAAPLAALALIPYVSCARILTSQAVIPHGSRENIFGNFIFSLMFFWAIYSFTVCLLPNAFAVAYRIPATRPLLAAALFQMVLGLGGVTPVPELLFGRLWEILTYDKFAFWGSLLYAPFVGVMALYASRFVEVFYLGNPRAESRRGVREALLAGLFVGLVASYALSSGLVISLRLQPLEKVPKEVLADIASMLDREADHYYITLGLHNQRLELSLMTEAPTLDGGYNSARQNPLLANSGVENIDAAKFFPNGIRLLKALLANASSLGIKYVVCADSYYDPLLLDYGFRVVKSYPTRPAVKVWVLDMVGPAALLKPPELPWFYPLLWGVTPLATLFSAAAIALLLALRGRSRCRG